MRHFGSVGGTSGGSDGDAEAEDEAAAHEAREVVAGGLDAGPYDYDDAADEHAPFATYEFPQKSARGFGDVKLENR